MKTFSKPITKIAASEMIVKALRSFHNYDLKEASELISKGSTDHQFIKEFNELMTVKIRSFAPGLFQIVYEN